MKITSEKKVTRKPKLTFHPQTDLRERVRGLGNIRNAPGQEHLVQQQYQVIFIYY